MKTLTKLLISSLLTSALLLFVTHNNAHADTFILTPNAGIPGFNQETHDGVSVETCKTLCRNRAWCKSADYERAANKCFLQQVNQFEQALRTDYPNNPYDHYYRGVSVGSAAAEAALKSIGRQCVKAKFGVGYVATVRWYQPLDVEYEKITRAISIRDGSGPVKTENIAVLEESCIESRQKMFAQVSVVGGKYANDAIKIASGAVITVAGVGAKAVICVGTVGAGCPTAVAAGTAVIGGAIQLTASLIPDAKTTFYLGSPGKLEISGTVWTPTHEETRKFRAGKAANESCSADSDCANNTCARDSARKGNRSICCPSGSEGLYFTREYCYGLERNQACWSNAMCGSGMRCRGNLGGAKRGECR